MLIKKTCMMGKNLDMVGRTDETKDSAWTSRACATTWDGAYSGYFLILGAWVDLHRNDT